MQMAQACSLLSHNAVMMEFTLRSGKLFLSCICPESLLSIYHAIDDLYFYSCKRFILDSTRINLTALHRIEENHIYDYIEIQDVLFDAILFYK